MCQFRIQFHIRFGPLLNKQPCMVCPELLADPEFQLLQCQPT